MMTDLDKAQRLADVADEITMRFYRSLNIEVTEKPDKTPVTEADLGVEEALSKIVSKEFGDAYRGEEGTDTTSHDARQWMVDPIDGTRNFIRHMPVWATLICLRDAQGAKVAVVSAPALCRRWWASRGEGAWTREVDGKVRKIAVSKVSTLDDAFLLFSSLFSWDKVPAGSSSVLDLLKSAWRHRAIGDFWNYMLVAEGAADACFEPNPKEWDIAAPGLIISEAGGVLWTDASPDTSPAAERIVIASNGLMQEELKKTLARK